ncbi:MAG: 4-hydroxy-tetrahydrodipicolinate reductase [Flavobacteriaceae bacterium]
MKLALLGYGKMGKAIEKIALERGHSIAYILDKEIENGNLSDSEVAINFSVPSAAVSNIKSALDLKIPVVCGTTGWLDQFQSIKAYTHKKESAFLYASNFSIGVNLFFKINAQVAQLMTPHKETYQAKIKEIHHIHKLDAPSGTAITMAEALIKENIYNQWELNGTNSKHLAIESVREGEVPGTHSITYTSKIDSIQLIHEAFNRDGFALGALIASEWIKGKKGIYSMQDVLNIP